MLHRMEALVHEMVQAASVSPRGVSGRNHVPVFRDRRLLHEQTHVGNILSATRRHPTSASLLVHVVLLSLLGQFVPRGPAESQPIDLVATTTVTDELTLEAIDLTVDKIEIQQQELRALPSLEAPAPSVEIAGTFGGGASEQLVDRSELLGLLGVASGELGMGTGERGRGTGEGGRGKYQRPFELLVETLRRDGLDLVIVFDSTSSMGAEIETVKARILQIGRSLIDKIPDTRIGFVTYKDVTDPPVAVGVPLTNDLDQLLHFTQSLSPD
jgi:hypothetical protein